MCLERDRVGFLQLVNCRELFKKAHVSVEEIFNMNYGEETNFCLFLVYRMVPHLTAVLSTTLPMLGMVKHDNMKWVFSAGRPLIYIRSLVKHA